MPGGVVVVAHSALRRVTRDRGTASGAAPDASDPLRVAVMVKTNDPMWIVPKIEELHRRGHDVTVILPPGPGQLTRALTARGITVVDSPFDFRFRPGVGVAVGLWRLRRLIRDLGIDVLHYHLYASALAARLSTLGRPVGRVHMVAGPLYLESRVIRHVERWLWRLDDVTICGSRHASRLYGALGCPAHRRPVIPYGLDVDRFAPPWASAENDPTAAAEGRARIRAELGLPADAFVAVMVAYAHAPKRMVHKGRGIKGHDVLLAAWQAFHARHPGSRLLLVGGGWNPAGDAYRKRLIRQFDVDGDPSVTWIESVSDVRPYYAAADLSVSPSLSELHGAAREAGVMGVPSVVSDVGGLPEVVDERCGWVVPPGDVAALAAALAAAHAEFEAGILAERGRRARERAVPFFDARTTAGRVADIIEATAVGSRRR
jgi:glycosyltransferase involved in cell wall biosynthesis